jgi:DNA-directed RNA polymerase subunit RPC12/RpoP/DNA polymerase elongation subunit (family B)
LKILLLDIETAPNKAYVWGLFKQNISPNHVLDASFVLCWTAKWLGGQSVYFDSVKKTPDQKKMLGTIHGLLDEADAVIHYNGRKFDIPVLNKEFLLHKLQPPAPYKEIDLYQLFKRRFRFESNRLDNVARRLQLGAKHGHEGFQMWVDCLDGKAAAWKEMEKYNRQDVLLLEKLYKRVLPWLDKHPVHGAFEDGIMCTNCGSKKFQQRGWQVTQQMKYKRYQCTSCGAWFRSNKSVSMRGEPRMVTIPA